MSRKAKRISLGKLQDQFDAANEDVRAARLAKELADQAYIDAMEARDGARAELYRASAEVAGENA